MPGQSRPEAVQFNQQEPTLEPVSSSLERLVRVSEYSRASLRRWPPASCQLATLRGSERVSASCNIKMMDLNSTACSRGQPKGQWAESVRSDKTTKCWGVKCRRRLQTDNKSIGIPIITQMANLLIPLLFLYHLQPCQSQLTKATTTTTAPSLLLGKTVNKVKQTSGSIQISVPEPSQLFLPPVSGDRAQFVEIFKSKGDDDEEEAGGFIMQSPSTPPADKQQPEDSTAPSSDPGADLTTTTTTADQQQVATTSAEELTTGSSQVKVGGEEDGRIAINASRQQFQTHDQLLQRSTKDEPISLPATGQGQSLSQDQSQGKQQGESFEGWQFPSLRSILSGLAHATSFLSDLQQNSKPNQGDHQASYRTTLQPQATQATQVPTSQDGAGSRQQHPTAELSPGVRPNGSGGRSTSEQPDDLTPTAITESSNQPRGSLYFLSSAGDGAESDDQDQSLERQQQRQLRPDPERSRPATDQPPQPAGELASDSQLKLPVTGPANGGPLNIEPGIEQQAASTTNSIDQPTACLGYCTLDTFLGLCDWHYTSSDCRGNQKCCANGRISELTGGQQASVAASGHGSSSSGQHQASNNGICRGTCLPVYHSSLCTKPNELQLNLPSCLPNQVCCSQSVTTSPILDGDNHLDEATTESSIQSVGGIMNQIIQLFKSNTGLGKQRTNKQQVSSAPPLPPPPPPAMHQPFVMTQKPVILALPTPQQQPFVAAPIVPQSVHEIPNSFHLAYAASSQTPVRVNSPAYNSIYNRQHFVASTGGYSPDNNNNNQHQQRNRFNHNLGQPHQLFLDKSQHLNDLSSMAMFQKQHYYQQQRPQSNQLALPKPASNVAGYQHQHHQHRPVDQSVSMMNVAASQPQSHVVSLQQVINRPVHQQQQQYHPQSQQHLPTLQRYPTMTTHSAPLPVENQMKWSQSGYSDAHVIHAQAPPRRNQPQQVVSASPLQPIVQPMPFGVSDVIQKHQNERPPMQPVSDHQQVHRQKSPPQDYSLEQQPSEPHYEHHESQTPSTHIATTALSQPAPLLHQSSNLQMAHATACGVPGSTGRRTSGRAKGRVMGGRDSDPGYWCWQAALMNDQNQYLCGGALIGTKWVLTAAHCVTQHLRNESQLYVRLGQTDLNSDLVPKLARSILVKTSYIHHNHNGVTLDNDVALLRLDEQVDLSDSSICTICLPDKASSQLEPGKRCTVTGYGYETEEGPSALRVRQTDVPIVRDLDCQNKTSAVLGKPFSLPASSFCAGGELGQDACHGDGGSPLSCLVNGFYELSGIVSWGYKCGNKDLPGLYAKVSNFVGWINQIVSVNN